MDLTLTVDQRRAAERKAQVPLADIERLDTPKALNEAAEAEAMSNGTGRAQSVTVRRPTPG